jgi:glutamate/aspartate transport system substrate-binding protein
MRRSLLCVLCVLCVGVLAGPARGAEVEGTLKKIKQDGAIRLGFRETAPPFSFLDPDSKPAGYSIALCLQIADALKTDLGLPSLWTRWVQVTPEDRIPLVVNGTVDIECGATTHTLAREAQVDFSHTTFVDGAGLIATVASGVKGVADLGGKRVGIIRGTTTEKALAEALQKHKVSARLIDIKDHAEALTAFARGVLEAYAADRVVLMDLRAKAKNPATVRLADEYLSVEHYALMFRREDPAFRQAVNRVLARLYRSGAIGPIYEKWFGAMGEASSMQKTLYQLYGVPE